MASKKTAENSRVREDFLSSFVKALIMNSITKEEIEEIKKERAQLRQSVENVRQKLAPIRQQVQPIPSIIHSIQPPVQLPPYRPQAIPQARTGETINLGKLTQILLDPSVLSIECPGAGKNILINRSGAIQTAQTTLTPDEIESVVNEFSEKTRIPFGVGLFKAAYQDLLMTAVISEYVGTRFIIQKRTPFSR